MFIQLHTNKVTDEEYIEPYVEIDLTTGYFELNQKELMIFIKELKAAVKELEDLL